MKKIIHQYDADLKWVTPLAEQLGGKVEGNFIKTSNYSYKGDLYFLNCDDGIVALHSDMTYYSDTRLIHNSTADDVICIYYSQTKKSRPKSSWSHASQNSGIGSYNMSVVGSLCDFERTIKAGSKVFTLYIFIKKQVLESHGQAKPVFRKKIGEIISQNKIVIRRERINIQSLQHLNDLRNEKADEPLFNLHLKATVHLLLSECLTKIADAEYRSRTIHPRDLADMVLAQQLLSENIENPFPGNKVIAEKFHMSESKFKSLFKQTTSYSPHKYFTNCKLLKAKELLEEKQLPIAQISDQLNFTSNSHFSHIFKNKFGVTPSTFLQQL